MRRVIAPRVTPCVVKLSVLVFVALSFSIYSVRAQTATAPQQVLSQAQLEQLVAPIALHPDPLLSQILMASTYPLEVVEAARWSKSNPNVTGQALEQAMLKQRWDASVKSLTAFPQVLEMMNDELSWTQQLGDAVLAQQADVLAAVQTLRERAVEQDTLVSDKHQKVEKQTVSTSTGGQETVIVIEPADPEMVYVPAYDPTVVYGTWPYPANPPYAWYPAGYVARGAMWFATGVAVGGALWGRCDWGRRAVSIDVNRYNSFNRTKITNARWQHNPRHRRAVPYRNRQVSTRYGRAVRDTRAREHFRGRAETGRRDLPAIRPGDRRPGIGGRPGGNGRPSVGTRPAGNKRPGAGARPSVARPPAKRSAAKPPAVKKPAAVKKRPAPKQRSRPAPRSSSAKRPAAYRGLGSGRQVKRHSARGQRSRTARHSRGGGRRR